VGEEPVEVEDVVDEVAVDPATMLQKLSGEGSRKQSEKKSKTENL
jgi:hypothetical protein